MRHTLVALLGCTLAGCVPPPTGPYAGPAYAPAYGPYGYYPSYAPAPLMVRLPEEPERVARPAARPRLAARPPAPRNMAAAGPATPASLPAGGTAAEGEVKGPECRTVTQVGYAEGKEVQRQERLCRGPGGDWVRP